MSEEDACSCKAVSGDSPLDPNLSTPDAKKELITQWTCRHVRNPCVGVITLPETNIASDKHM